MLDAALRAGLGTNDDLLITVVCCLTNDELTAAKEQYMALYGVPR